MRRLWNVPLLASALSLGTALFLPPQPVQGQPPAARATPDTARMRRALAAAMGENFEIVRTELSGNLRERGGTFWLVYAQPQQSGYFQLTYRYDDPGSDPHYTHVEHTSVIRVGEEGCWRMREAKDVCLGDTIILPFVADRYTGHAFTLTWRGPPTAFTPADDVEPQQAPGADTVPNPLAAHLRYLGTESYDMLRRSGGGNTVYSAEFQAVAPGRFNLSVHGSGSAVGSVPVVIVPRGQPVTVLLRGETVVGYNGRFSAHTGNHYMTTLLLLQPGDRISLEYAGSPIPIRPVDDSEAAAKQAPRAPDIHGFPFRLDLEQRFNAWIAPHLPVSR